MSSPPPLLPRAPSTPQRGIRKYSLVSQPPTLNAWNILEKSCSSPSEAISSVGFPRGKGETSQEGRLVLVWSWPSGKSVGWGCRGRHTSARNESASEPGKAQGGSPSPTGHPLGIAAGQERAVGVPKFSQIQHRWRDSLLCEQKPPEPRELYLGRGPHVLEFLAPSGF